jgi:hypothetical protein
MGIKTLLAIGLCLVTVSAKAAPTTNSWTGSSTNYWDNDGDWSLGQSPNDTNVNGYTFITNAASATVFIDRDDPEFYYWELTVSNLTVGAPIGTTNTLSLTNMNIGGDVPLTIINSLVISNGGVLQINNSMLEAYNASFTNGSVLALALGTNSTPIVVSNNLFLASTLDVTAGAGFTSTNYTIIEYFGTLTYGGLTIGSVPSNTTCTVSTSTPGQINVNVAISAPLQFQITSIVRSANNITLTWTAPVAGMNIVQAGNGGASGLSSTNILQNISTNIIVTAGSTNSYTDVGGATNAPSRYYRISFPQ